VGQRQLFVRFIGCDLRCRYCDTPDAVRQAAAGKRHPCRVQVSSRTFDREAVPNPLTCDALSAFCERLRVDPGPARQVLSITGGEPLLQAAFLRNWLPEVRKSFRIYLETSGIHHEAMRMLSGLIDIVSMDIKLPSAAGQGERWNDHRAFLQAAASLETYVKVVATGSTTLDDILHAARIVAEHSGVLFVIQPAAGTEAPTAARLIEMQNQALGVLDDVRVIPQVHTLLHVP
jgi:7-carboxy-7-deazaguanine synthase